MNEQNLIPNSERTPSQLAEMGRKGGVASGESKRERKLAKQIAIDVLDSVVKGKDGREMTMKELMIEKLLRKTINDPKAKDVDFVLALIGEEVERRQTHIIESDFSEEDKRYFAEHFGMNISNEESE